MIRSFADTETERFYNVGKSRRYPPSIQARAAMRLTQLNAATRLDDLRLPPSNRLEALKRDRVGQWSIRINDQWRVCFRFESGDAFNVEIRLPQIGVSMNKDGLPPIHPGEFLREILEELDISQAKFARAIGISPMRVSHVVNGARPVTAELALLFSRAFHHQSPQYWLNLQAAYDLKTTETAIAKQLRAVPDLSSV